MVFRGYRVIGSHGLGAESARCIELAKVMNASDIVCGSIALFCLVVVFFSSATSKREYYL
jgi:hypothetical protein